MAQVEILGQASVRQVRFSPDVERASHQQPSDANLLDNQASSWFPFEPFAWLPLPVKALIPRTWQKIQDKTHFILVFGAIACTLLVVRMLVALINSGCVDLNCVEEVLTILFIVPCTTYNIRIIGQYDDRLVSKQQDIKEQKASLTRSYNDLLSDMDGLLSKSAESSAGLAERSFESKRRDFQRFLERVKGKHSSLYSGAQGDSDKLLKQFRRFCVNWLRVFEECSIDPLECPKRVIKEEELNRCTSILDIADLCLERLRVTEVRFISIQRDQDAQMLRKNRNEIKRLSRALPGVGGAGRPVPEVPGRRTSTQGRGSWLHLGFGHGFGVHSGGTGEEPYPKEIDFFCGQLILLSSEHLMLILGFLVGWALFAIQFWDFVDGGAGTRLASVLSLVELLIAELCLVTMLLKFEEIDIVQQLEREVKELAKQNERVEKQRERMHGFWNNVQQLTELWLYRTVPRLDLFKEIHSLLEDTTEDLLMKISSANQHLEDLENRLGDLTAWRNNGTVSIEAKKGFGKAVNQICQEQELDECLVKLEDLTSGGMEALTNSNAK